MNRRRFLALATTAALTAGCQSTNKTAPQSTRSIDAGPASSYASNGVYIAFRDQGFFIIRRGDQLLVLSSFCTHRHCRLTAEQDRTFYCNCHGSTFDPDGKVTEGPARRDLPSLPYEVNDDDHLIVTVSV